MYLIERYSRTQGQAEVEGVHLIIDAAAFAPKRTSWDCAAVLPKLQNSITVSMADMTFFLQWFVFD